MASSAAKSDTGYQERRANIERALAKTTVLAPGVKASQVTKTGQIITQVGTKQGTKTTITQPQPTSAQEFQSSILSRMGYDVKTTEKGEVMATKGGEQLVISKTGEYVKAPVSATVRTEFISNLERARANKAESNRAEFYSKGTFMSRETPRADSYQPTPGGMISEFKPSTEQRIQSFLRGKEGTIVGIGGSTVYAGYKYAKGYASQFVAAFNPKSYYQIAKTVVTKEGRSEFMTGITSLGTTLREDPFTGFEIAGGFRGFGKGSSLVGKGIKGGVKLAKEGSNRIIFESIMSRQPILGVTTSGLSKPRGMSLDLESEVPLSTPKSRIAKILASERAPTSKFTLDLEKGLAKTKVGKGLNLEEEVIVKLGKRAPSIAEKPFKIPKAAKPMLIQFEKMEDIVLKSTPKVKQPISARFKPYASLIGTSASAERSMSKMSLAVGSATNSLRGANIKAIGTTKITNRQKSIGISIPKLESRSAFKMPSISLPKIATISIGKMTTASTMKSVSKGKMASAILSMPKMKDLQMTIPKMPTTKAKKIKLPKIDSYFKKSLYRVKGYKTPKSKYRPSLVAGEYKIRGRPSKLLTGLEIRPY